METKAELTDVVRKGNKFLMTFSVDELPTDDLRGSLRLSAKPWKEKRSNQANALLWEMLSKIAQALGTDKWDVYLQMLKKYGKATYCIVPKGGVEQLQASWRETEVLGDIKVNGRDAVQVACYFGTSAMDTAEFSHFIDAVKNEMADMELETPCSADMRRAIENYEKYYAK